MFKRILLALILLVATVAFSPVFAHGSDPRPAAAAPSTATELAAPDEVAGSGQPAAAAAAQQPAEGANVMVHPGLPEEWLQASIALMGVIGLWSLFAGKAAESAPRSINLAGVPVIGGLVRFLNASPYPLLAARLAAVSVFLVVISAGFFGTIHPEHNIATAFVWNIWWPLVIVAVFFIGSAWCAICPWDTLAGWIVRRSWFKRVTPHPGLNLRCRATCRTCGSRC
ncbi:4Fe-4S binding protein [Ramlibacter montanisoli]|uniref:4Fe-4S binding protein n=1 Tax=Ramlibacter montanisoli TaxID=2732512 RepID=A0A849K7E0_9BURK|nr:4Fe-4S binding protein [Ramlibacter montanisoli]NNU43440.1 4Fe-4S binding protein [Ramlibacter montanisoli]